MKKHILALWVLVCSAFAPALAFAQNSTGSSTPTVDVSTATGWAVAIAAAFVLIGASLVSVKMGAAGIRIAPWAIGQISRLFRVGSV